MDKASLRVSLQANTEWLRDGSTQTFQELVLASRLSSRTSLESSVAFAERPVLDRLRVRLSQKLRNDLAIVAEVGRFPAFQAPVVAGEEFPSRLKVFVRKMWNVNTPARGGLVTGRVLDTGGAGVSRIVVRLGRYRTERDRLESSSSSGCLPVYVDRNGNGAADPGEGIAGAVLKIADTRFTQSRDDGRYAFHNLEPGRYSVELMADRTPKLQTESEGVRKVDLDARTRTSIVDFRVVLHDKPVVIHRLERR